MKAAVYIHKLRNSSVSPHMEAMARGLRRHGVDVIEFHDYTSTDVDFCVTWGLRKAERCKAQGFNGPYLIMERGYIGDRMRIWTSLGWDGLNGHARFNGVWDENRFDKNFSSDLKPWRSEDSGYALIMGQVVGDMSLVNVDIVQWYKDTATELWKAGWDIRFRPHPMSDKKGHERPHVPFSKISEGSLQEALSGAALVCAFNSNSLVDAVMAGVPVYAGDRGSMVYDLASRDFNPIYPDREKRLNEVANCQWTIDEISSGKAWKIVREAM
jgi:hypothetical protein